MSNYIIGDYKILKKIGKGSFSNVFKAHKLDDENAFYAIKIVSLKNLSNKIIENIKNEINIMLKINHENIIKLHETITSHKYIYLIMDYCDGGDLYKFIKKHGKLSEEESKKYFLQISKGLHFLYSKNLIHRDLKPHNILITSNNILKICDFGFVKESNENMLYDTLCGSPIYMAPEILKYKKYDSKVDLWSMGIILFEMLTSKPPFIGINHIDLIRVIDSTELMIPNDITISNVCFDLLKSLIVVNPENRISFENFFKHSFFENYNFDNNFISIKDDIIIEEENNDDKLSITPIENYIGNNLKNKEQHEIEIVLNYKIYVESIYRSASEVGYIGFAKENENKYLDALSVYIKSLNLLEHALNICEKVIIDFKLNDVIYKIQKEIQNKFLLFFTKLNKIWKKIKDVEKIIYIQNADKIIYFYAMEMIKEGASCDILNETVNAKQFYIWSLRLLESLTMDEIPLDEHDNKIINNFISKLLKRIN
jgi:serine/threonine-protein kinase ULK/ATG1